jgi:hypothetical protein
VDAVAHTHADGHPGAYRHTGAYPNLDAAAATGRRSTALRTCPYSSWTDAHTRVSLQCQRRDV